MRNWADEKICAILCEEKLDLTIQPEARFLFQNVIPQNDFFMRGSTLFSSNSLKKSLHFLFRKVPGAKYLPVICNLQNEILVVNRPSADWKVLCGIARHLKWSCSLSTSNPSFSAGSLSRFQNTVLAKRVKPWRELFKSIITDFFVNKLVLETNRSHALSLDNRFLGSRETRSYNRQHGKL